MGSQRGVNVRAGVSRSGKHGKMMFVFLPRSVCIARKVRKPMKSATVPVIALRIKAISPMVASRETVSS